MKTLTVFKLNSNRKYATFVNTSKGEICVRFEPVVLYGRIENCIYGTNNEEIIEGLKQHPLYGSLIYIAEEGVEQDAPKVIEVPAEGDVFSYLADPTNPIMEESVTSAATANLWVQKTHGETFSATKVADIKVEAARRFNTIFPNWK